jgi:hypothetical protein
MTKVRVSEETPNLSHPSNLISTVRLENPSPSLMRSTRARGRTHSWVVQAFLLREQERARERSSLRRETAFAEGEHQASQGKEHSTDFKAADNKEEQAYHTDLWRSYNI